MYSLVAWVSLGQLPNLDNCMNLLYLQLSGTGFASAAGGDISIEQKQEYLKQEFRNRTVLLVLDDCWDAEVAKHLVWIDEVNTSSKVLISSRVREVLEGVLVTGSAPEVIDVPLPSSEDAARMLLSAAGMREEGAAVAKENQAVEEKKLPVKLAEAVRVVDLCKRLPLTIGIAAKLIRQLAITGNFTGVFELLQEEMAAAKESSVEEGVIRASVKAIPEQIRKNVVRLFHGFSLVPEDCQIPLDVLAMIYEACDPPGPPARRGSISGHCDNGAAKGNGKKKGISRLHIRKYLKVLIDRSLVLGTVDRPQLHDIVWEYVKDQMSPEELKAAQRRLVESFRKANRSEQWPLGKYIQENTLHHITQCYDEEWAAGTQALSWLDDHVGGVQDAISTSTATLLPVQQYAKEAEDAHEWWKAALRWRAISSANKKGSFGHGAEKGGFDGVFLAACAARNLVMQAHTVEMQCNDSDRDTFLLLCLTELVMRWSVSLAEDNPWINEILKEVCLSESALSNPTFAYRGLYIGDWYVSIVSGDEVKMGEVNLKLIQFAANVEEEGDRGRWALPNVVWAMLQTQFSYFAGNELVSRLSDFTWEMYGGANGERYIEALDSYVFEEHHEILSNMCSLDLVGTSITGEWPLLCVYGLVEAATKPTEKKLRTLEKVKKRKEVSQSWRMEYCFAMSMNPVLYFLLNKPALTMALFDTIGITFDNAEAFLQDVCGATILFADWLSEEANSGYFSTTRVVYQVKAFCILHGNVPTADAMAWIKSLPSNKQLSKYSVLISNEATTHDQGTLVNIYQSCWMALAAEKLGLFEDALRFAEFSVEPDLAKGGTFSKWTHALAHCSKGRILAKDGKHAEANTAFQAGVDAAKQSTLPLIEALALRELAQHDCSEFVQTALRAKQEVVAKLDTFQGRLSLEEFAALRFAP